MKVGSSSVHYLPGQETNLENFSQYLKSKERDAYELIKEKKFLKDKEQEPAIRVALRAIKDFALAFQKGEEIIWRYFNVSEKEFEPPQEKPSEKQTQENIKPEEKKVEIFDSPKKESPKKEISPKPKEIKPRKKPQKRSASKKKNEKFFNQVKTFLTEKEIEILDIQSFNKSDLTLRIKDQQGEEKLLIAYNKKRLTEKDIINAHKKALEHDLKYILLSLGEPAKKITALIEAVQNLSRLEKIE